MLIYPLVISFLDLFHCSRNIVGLLKLILRKDARNLFVEIYGARYGIFARG